MLNKFKVFIFQHELNCPKIQFYYILEIKHKYENAKGTSPSSEIHEHNEDGLHSVIGLALLLGFVFMLLIDQIGSAKSRGKFK